MLQRAEARGTKQVADMVKAIALRGRPEAVVAGTQLLSIYRQQLGRIYSIFDSNGIQDISVPTPAEVHSLEYQRSQEVLQARIAAGDPITTVVGFSALDELTSIAGDLLVERLRGASTASRPGNEGRLVEQLIAITRVKSDIVHTFSSPEVQILLRPLKPFLQLPPKQTSTRSPSDEIEVLPSPWTRVYEALQLLADKEASPLPVSPPRRGRATEAANLPLTPDQIESMTLGQILRAYRVGFGLTQGQLAKKAGISVSYPSAIERDAGRISLSTLNTLMRTLGLSPEAQELLRRKLEQS